MNFYKRFIGDIQRDTGHLSLAEFGAYDRLLDHYYATESALPSDVDACCRIARAMSKDERKAVTFILSQHFILTERGFEQGRAEKEIADAQPAMVSARLNGAKGGRPKKHKNETQDKPNGLSENNPNATQGESSPEPEPYNELSNISEGGNVTSVNENSSPTKSGEVCAALVAVGVPIVNPQSQRLLGLLVAGVDVSEFVDVAIEQKSKPGGRLDFNYILATVSGRRSDVKNKKTSGRYDPYVSGAVGVSGGAE